MVRSGTVSVPHYHHISDKRMKSSEATWLAILVAVIAIIALWYWYAQSGVPNPSTDGGLNGSLDQGSFATTTESSTPGTSGAVLQVATSTSGSFLTAANGMTLYTTANDTAGTSTCASACAATWPPYTVTTADALRSNASATGIVSTITRTDGTLQVTYDGMPLYFYANDTAAGQARGRGLGGVWSVALP